LPEDVVEELAMLRRSIIELWKGKDDRWVLNRALDRAILVAAIEFIRERDSEMRRAVELRDRILAVVSHDLRNPLGAIDLGAALLLGNQNVCSDPIARRQAETIQRSARRMDRLIADLLDMSSIQAGRFSLQRSACPLEPLLTEAADAHEPPAGEKGISLRRDFRAAAAIVYCDHDRMLQVLSNLLGNAIKFCGTGDAITIAARVLGDDTLVSVLDTGPGISEEDLSQIFELYWQGKAREQRGTGLGLFISKGIVEAHGGKLWVESAPGAGSAFFLTLPLAKKSSG
jgi:signal transduction histidine kinase